MKHRFVGPVHFFNDEGDPSHMVTFKVNGQKETAEYSTLIDAGRSRPPFSRKPCAQVNPSDLVEIKKLG